MNGSVNAQIIRKLSDTIRPYNSRTIQAPAGVKVNL